ncbi:uncharacterized protein LOC116585294 isoform X2 [Mustela erminea]|uniref:uncharacterized protein LOC116585294 isoform X2 n=1 Tax=Mustela erminea TaxID=36723 RepID=UPI001386BBDC|nr:uncharacterized protein LOC116585294 isoform X2 [Mustela erminea]
MICSLGVLTLNTPPMALEGFSDILTPQISAPGGTLCHRAGQKDHAEELLQLNQTRYSDSRVTPSCWTEGPRSQAEKARRQTLLSPGPIRAVSGASIFRKDVISLPARRLSLTPLCGFPLHAGLCGTFCPLCLSCQIASDMDECCLCGASVAMRTLYRTRYGIPGSICGDFLWLGCFPLCTLCQLKRDIEKRKAMNAF